MDIFEIILNILFVFEIIFYILFFASFVISLISFIISFAKNFRLYEGDDIYIDKNYINYVRNPSGNDDIKRRIHRNYFFGPGFYQIRRIFKDSCKRLNNWEEKLFNKNKINAAKTQKKHEKEVKYAKVFFALPFLVAFSLFLFLPLIFGTICFFVCFLIPWLIEGSILRIKSISNRCSFCYRKFSKPAYKCNFCGVRHKNLLPGPYGIFFRKCECGKSKLPTTYLGRKNTNHKAICPRCENEISSSDSQQYGIQLVGRTRAGKTTFLSAFWHEYDKYLKSDEFNNYLKENNIIAFSHEGEPSDFFKKLKEWFEKGKVDSTNLEDKRKCSIIHSIEEGSSKVEMAIYDIAGEVFGAKINEQQQQQFEYCDSFLVLVDPLPENIKDSAGFVSEGISNFINSFDRYRKIETDKMDSTPVAVLITKGDLFESEIGLHNIKKLAKENGIATDDINSVQFQKFQSDECKKFLINHDFSNVVNIIEGKFSNVMYFPISAMGHSNDTIPFEPWGVLDPIFWLMNDKKCPLQGIAKSYSILNNSESSSILENEKKTTSKKINSIIKKYNKKWIAITAAASILLISTGATFLGKYISFRNSIYAPLFEAIAFNNQKEVANLIERDRADLNYINFLGKTPLKLAISNNNEEMVSFLIAEGADGNLEDSWKWTPLEYAVSKGKEEIVSCLVREGADINLEDSDGWTPLTHAISIGDGEMVSCLIKAGAGKNFEDSNGRTPLKYAIEIGDTDMISVLLENGEDINFADKRQYTPLLFAIEKNKLRPAKEDEDDDYLTMDYINKFIPMKKGIKGKRPDYLKYIPHKYRKLYKNNKNIILHLLDNGANPNLDLPNIETPLRFAVAKKDKDIISLLLEKNAEINFVDSKNNTPLHRAILDDSESMVNYLLEKGAEIDYDVKGIETPLRYAISQNNKNMVSHLIKNGSTIDYLDKSKWTPMEYSISLNNKEMVSLLNDKGVGINAEDSRKKTPLRWAVFHNKAEMISHLIELGANPNYFDSEKFTPLTYAISKNNREMVKALIKNKNGANPNLDKDNRGNIIETPLKYAISSDKVEMIKPLIENGANPDLDKDTNGKAVSTPLIYAIDKNKKEMVSQLIKCGANANYYDSQGRTPLLYAVSNDNKNGMIEVLLNPNLKGHANPDLGEDGKGNAIITPLKRAIDLDKKDMVRVLIENGANADYYDSLGWTPLRYTISRKNDKNREEIIKTLLNPKLKGHANPNFSKSLGKDEYLSTPLIYAININDRDMVRVLKNNGADINCVDVGYWTPLTYAISKNNKDMVSYLIDLGAEKNYNAKLAEKNVLTPLQKAIKDGNKEMITLLVNKRADINYGKFNRTTPLQYAIRSSTEDMVLFLIKEKNALVDYKDETGCTPIRAAIDAEKKNMISLLLKNGLKVNKAGADGRTPLENAIYSNKPEMVKYLIQQEKADVNHKNNGKRPLEYASERKLTNIISILKTYGARSKDVD